MNAYNKLITMLLIVLCIISCHDKQYVNDEIDKLIKLDYRTNISEIIRISKAEFVSNDKEIILADTIFNRAVGSLTRRIIIYNIKTQKIEAKLTDIEFNGKSSKLYCPSSWTFEEYPTFIPNKQFAISYDFKRLATLTCDEKILIISIFDTKKLVPLAIFSIEKGELYSGNIYFSNNDKYIALITSGREAKYNITVWNNNDFSIIKNKKLLIDSKGMYWDAIIEFVNLDKLIIEHKDAIKSLNLQDDSVSEKLEEKDSIIDYLFTDKYIIYSSSVPLNNRENELDGLCIKINKYAQKKFSFVSKLSYDNIIVALINKNILVYNEKRAKKAVVQDNKGKEYETTKIYENIVHYLNIIDNKYMMSLKLHPECDVISISNNGQIMLLECENKVRKKEYFLAYIDEKAFKLITTHMSIKQ